MKYLNIILNNDIQNFNILPLEQRVILFKQIAKIFDLGQSLLPLFNNRTLTNYDVYQDSKTYSSSYFNMQSNVSPRQKGSKIMKGKQSKRSKSKSQKKH